MNTSKCPACGAQESNAREVEGYRGSVVKCNDCGGIYTREGSSIYKGDSYNLVKPWMSDRPDMEDACYFDLTVLGSDGVTRRHGWYDPQTKMILQVG